MLRRQKLIRTIRFKEHIDLAELARVAASDPHANDPGTSKSTFAVVVKLPCLAVKYPTGNGHIRRFQIKFGQDRDYYAALAILSDIKCPFSEPSIGPMPLTRRPSTTQWQMGSSSIKASTVGETPAADRYMSHGALVQPHGITASASAAPSSVTAAQASLPSSSSTMHNVPPDFWTNGTNQGGMRDDMASGQTLPMPPNSNAPVRRPSTATTCYDTNSLEAILPPKRKLPFLQPAPPRAPTVPESSTMRSQIPPVESMIENAESTQSGVCNLVLTTSLELGSNPREGANCRPATSAGHIFRKPDQTGRSTDVNARAIAPAPKRTKISPPENPSTLPKPTSIPISLPTEPSPVPSCLPPNQQHHEPGNSAQSTSAPNISFPEEDAERQDLAPALANLSSYLSAPTAERTKSLENWICQHIEDDGFIQLCQDVESIWRRIAVGK
ncbi:uncharacterized protein LDX57_005439 [Aspergillus melleus]|uniref:uncharacterized protein n=1 Tax=Aspergillus melleus TaxID=138277 RepID=UPI001E8D98FD|nr:uncharacterized protein LDX57_005439 [Aspergillus melleus]KAH8427730.1 hypothetical protein LDX57_005439 [Aspergillus melleus]